MTVISARVYTEVHMERERQDAKWGPHDHIPIEWMSVLTEEVGEAAEAANNCHWHASPEWIKQFRDEMIQVAAVAVAAVEYVDRNFPEIRQIVAQLAREETA